VIPAVGLPEHDDFGERIARVFEVRQTRVGGLHKGLDGLAGESGGIGQGLDSDLRLIVQCAGAGDSLGEAAFELLALQLKRLSVLLEQLLDPLEAVGPGERRGAAHFHDALTFALSWWR
jgi:hypothetical protein